LSKQIPWLRVFVEGVVIVASILLAFGIEAWWDGRQEAEERSQLLSTMRESVQLNRASLEENIEGSESAQARTRRFIEMENPELAAVSTDTALSLLTSLNRPNTRQASRGPLSRLLDSGRLSLISEPSIIAALDQWLVQVTELEERARNLAEVELAVLTALGPHEAFRMRNTVERESLPPTMDLRPIHDDDAVISAANVMLFERNVYVLYCRRTLETLEGLEHLIGASLE
jgi:hypothetical protein